MSLTPESSENNSTEAEILDETQASPTLPSSPNGASSSNDVFRDAPCAALQDDLAVMLKNIPCRCCTEDVLDLLASHGFPGSSLTFFMMPTPRSGRAKSKQAGHNLGYAFVGLPDSDTAKRFWREMKGVCFPGRKSTKSLDLAHAKIQGLHNYEKNLLQKGQLHVSRRQTDHLQTSFDCCSDEDAGLAKDVISDNTKYNFASTRRLSEIQAAAEGQNQESTSTNGASDDGTLASAKLLYEVSQDKMTVILKNIPLGCSEQEVVDSFEAHGFADTCKFLYMPFDEFTQANLGHASLRFPNPDMANRFLEDMQDVKISVCKNQKIGEVEQSKLRGIAYDMKKLKTKSSHPSVNRKQPTIAQDKTYGAANNADQRASKSNGRWNNQQLSEFAQGKVQGVGKGDRHHVLRSQSHEAVVPESTYNNVAGPQSLDASCQSAVLQHSRGGSENGSTGNVKAVPSFLPLVDLTQMQHTVDFNDSWPYYAQGQAPSCSSCRFFAGGILYCGRCCQLQKASQDAIMQ